MLSLTSSQKDLSRMAARLIYRDTAEIRRQLSNTADSYAVAAAKVAPDLMRLVPRDDRLREMVERWVSLAARLREVAANPGSFSAVTMPPLLDSLVQAEAQLSGYLTTHSDHVRWRVCIGRFEREQAAYLGTLMNPTADKGRQGSARSIAVPKANIATG